MDKPFAVDKLRIGPPPLGGLRPPPAPTAYGLRPRFALPTRHPPIPLLGPQRGRYRFPQSTSTAVTQRVAAGGALRAPRFQPPPAGGSGLRAAAPDPGGGKPPPGAVAPAPPTTSSIKGGGCSDASGCPSGRRMGPGRGVTDVGDGSWYPWRVGTLPPLERWTWPIAFHVEWLPVFELGRQAPPRRQEAPAPARPGAVAQRI